MKRTCLIGLTALVVLGGAEQDACARPKGRISSWSQAVNAAKQYNRLIFCIYTPGITRLYGPGKASDNTAGEATGWAIISVIAQPPVRKLQNKYYVVAHLRMGDPKSNWGKFASQTSSACFFVTHQEEFLEAVSVDVTVAEFTKAAMRAVAKAKKLRAADPPTPAELTEAAEQAIEMSDYTKAMARIDEVLKAVKKTSMLNKRVVRLRKTIIGRATGGIKQAEDLLKRKKPLPAFRKLDEVVHLFTILPQAAEAEGKLEALLADPKWADAAKQYRPRRKAYELFDEAIDLEAAERWKEAIVKFKEIIDRYKQSPIIKRTAKHLKRCREAMGRGAGL